MPRTRFNYVSLLLTLAVLASGCARAGEQVAPESDGSKCPVTKVKRSDYGNEYLRAILPWKEMIIVFKRDGPGFRYEDGSRSIKVAWNRLVSGNLTIKGRRLDAAAPPLRAQVLSGYGDVGGISTTLIFPTQGCWEVTGMISGHSLTFVAQVVFND